jgi:hypothetical protein
MTLSDDTFCATGVGSDTFYVTDGYKENCCDGFAPSRLADGGSHQSACIVHMGSLVLVHVGPRTINLNNVSLVWGPTSVSVWEQGCPKIDLSGDEMVMLAEAVGRPTDEEMAAEVKAMKKRKADKAAASKG